VRGVHPLIPLETFEFRWSSTRGTHKSLNIRSYFISFSIAISPCSGRKRHKIMRLSHYTAPRDPSLRTPKIDGPKIHTHSCTCKHGPAMTLPNRKVQSSLHALSRTDPFGSANLPERRSCSMHPVCHSAYPSQWAVAGGRLKSGGRQDVGVSLCASRGL
jgi:hypothetical protein